MTFHGGNLPPGTTPEQLLEGLNRCLQAGKLAAALGPSLRRRRDYVDQVAKLVITDAPTEPKAKSPVVGHCHYCGAARDSLLGHCPDCGGNRVKPVSTPPLPLPPPAPRRVVCGTASGDPR